MRRLLIFYIFTRKLSFRQTVTFGLLPRHEDSLTISLGLSVFDKGKPAARRGRKVMGLWEIADRQTAESCTLGQSFCFFYIGGAKLKIQQYALH
jgi:hypothetical protein